MKRCSNCFKIKPVTDFYRKLERYQSRCKACNNEVVRGYMQQVRERKKWAWIREPQHG